MDIQNQVCSVDQAKELRALGIKQKSFLYWFLPYGQTEWGITALDFVQSFGYEETFEDTYKEMIKHKDQERMYSAFTVAELGAMIPDNYTSERVTLPKGKKSYVIESPNKKNCQFAETEGISRAGILITGLKKGDIILEEANKRLLKK